MSIRAGSILTIAVLSLAIPTGTAQANPSLCPAGQSGFVLWNVDTEPYQADNHVDAAGNDNGWVCARDLPRTFLSAGEQYQAQNFIDDHR